MQSEREQKGGDQRVYKHLVTLDAHSFPTFKLSKLFSSLACFPSAQQLDV